VLVPGRGNQRLRCQRAIENEVVREPHALLEPSDGLVKSQLSRLNVLPKSARDLAAEEVRSRDDCRVFELRDQARRMQAVQDEVHGTRGVEDNAAHQRSRSSRMRSS